MRYAGRLVRVEPEAYLAGGREELMRRYDAGGGQ